MLKVSALLSNISQDIHTATRFTVECGLDGLDIDFVWRQPVEKIAASEDAKSLQLVLKNAGVPAFSLATSLFNGWLDSTADFQENLQSLEKCLDLAELLNTPLIRCFSFRSSGNRDENLPRLLDYLGKAAEMAKKRGVVLGIQNDEHNFLSTGKITAEFIRQAGKTHLQSIWNSCAALSSKDHPEIPFPDGYQHVRPFLAQVILRDVDRHKFRGSLREVEFGEGLIDYRKQIKALLSDGFTGSVSLAANWRPGMDWDTTLDEADFTEQGGQEAVRICLRNLEKMING